MENELKKITATQLYIFTFVACVVLYLFGIDGQILFWAMIAVTTVKFAQIDEEKQEMTSQIEKLKESCGIIEPHKDL